MHHKSDWIGILGSFLCVIHCVLLPFVLSAASFVEFLDGPLEIMFLSLSSIAVYFSTKNFQTTKLKIGLWLSWGLLVLGTFIHEYNIIGIYIQICGSISLIFHHYQSYLLHNCKIETETIEF